MRYDLTDMIGWKECPTLAIRTAANGDEYVLPPYATIQGKPGKQRFYVNLPAKITGQVAYLLYAEASHTDPMGNNSLYWAYKHMILDLSKNASYVKNVCEGSYRSRNAGVKASKSLYDELGLSPVRGITLIRKKGTNTDLVQIAYRLGGKMNYVYGCSVSRVHGVICSIIHSAPQSWRNRRVIPAIYL